MPAAIGFSFKLFETTNELDSDVSQAEASDSDAADNSKHLSQNLISKVYGLEDFKSLAKPWHPSFVFNDKTKNGAVSLELGYWLEYFNNSPVLNKNKS